MDILDMVRYGLVISEFVVVPINPQFPNEGIIEELAGEGLVYDRVRFWSSTDNGTIRWARDIEGDCAIIMPRGYIPRYNYDETERIDWVETKGYISWGDWDILLGHDPEKFATVSMNA